MIAVFASPRSRRNRADPGLNDRLRLLLGARGEVWVPAGIEALHERIAGLERPEILAINGGDGTGSLVMGAWLATRADPLPPVALLRGGTMNTVATSVGLSGDPEGLLRGLLAGHRVLARRRLLLAGGRAGFLFGNGLITNFLEEYYSNPEPSPVVAAEVLSRAIAGALLGGDLAARLARPARVAVELEGETWPAQDWLTIGAGTIDQIGLGFAPFFRAPREGGIHLLGIDAPLQDLALQLPRIFRGLSIAGEGVREAVVSRLVLHAEGPQPYMVDGDLCQGPESLEVCLGPEIELLAPA